MYYSCCTCLQTRFLWSSGFSSKWDLSLKIILLKSPKFRVERAHNNCKRGHWCVRERNMARVYIVILNIVSKVIEMLLTVAGVPITRWIADNDEPSVATTLRLSLFLYILLPLWGWSLFSWHCVWTYVRHLCHNYRMVASLWPQNDERSLDLSNMILFDQLHFLSQMVRKDYTLRKHVNDA